MNRIFRYRPRIPLKPTLFFYPSSECCEEEHRGVIGWSYVHPKSLKVISGQDVLGHRLDLMSSDFCRLFRHLAIHWPYWDKMRLHYPFFRPEEMRKKSALERSVYEGIRRFSAENDFRMSCSQYPYACAHVTGSSSCKDFLMLRRLRSLGHRLNKTQIAVARSIVFLYYEQRAYWAYVHEEKKGGTEVCEA